jgi:hypothetical protein
MSEQWHGGKGSKTRPIDQQKFDSNWDKIFGSKSRNNEQDDEYEQTTGSVHEKGFRKRDV